MNKSYSKVSVLALAAWSCLVASGATVSTTLSGNGTGSISGASVTVSGTVSLTGVGSGTLSSSFNLLSAASGSIPLTLTITSGTTTGTLTCTLTASATLLAQVVSG